MLRRPMLWSSCWVCPIGNSNKWGSTGSKSRTRHEQDGKFHSVSGLPTPGGGGFTIVCGRGTQDEFDRLQFLCMLNKYKHRAPIWLGIGAVPEHEGDPFAVILDSRSWAPDPELDRLFPVWPIPGTAMGSREE